MAPNGLKPFAIILIALTPFLSVDPGMAQQESPFVAEAKREGEIVWYGSLTVGTVGWILKAFEDRYPFIRTRYLLAISAKSPHPNAARLFFDFVASKEGQELLTAEGFISPRPDVRPRFPRLRLQGIKHLFPSDPKVSERLEVWIKEFHQTFKVQ